MPVLTLAANTGEKFLRDYYIEQLEREKDPSWMQAVEDRETKKVPILRCPCLSPVLFASLATFRRVLFSFARVRQVRARDADGVPERAGRDALRAGLAGGPRRSGVVHRKVAQVCQECFLLRDTCGAVGGTGNRPTATLAQIVHFPRIT